MTYRLSVLVVFAVVSACNDNKDKDCPPVPSCQTDIVSILDASGASLGTFSGVIILDGTTTTIQCPGDLNCASNGIVIEGGTDITVTVTAGASGCGTASSHINYVTDFNGCRVCPDESSVPVVTLGACDDTTPSVHAGDVVIHTQGDADAFAVVVVVNGNVSIQPDEQETSISLPNLASISGDLTLGAGLGQLNMPALTTVSGLSVLGTSLIVTTPLPALTAFSALDVENNTVLSDCAVFALMNQRYSDAASTNYSTDAGRFTWTVTGKPALR